MTDAKPKMSLGQKMIAIMDEMQAVKKEGFNVNQKYPFVQEADVVNAVRPLLIKYGVLIHQTVFVGPDGLPWVQKNGQVTTIVYEMQLVDAETGETWPKSLIVQDGWDQGDKGPNKTLTGANKWFHMRTWQIGAGTKEESEGDEKTDKLAGVDQAKAGPRIARGAQPGVQRGGKSSLATKAQISEVARLVRDLDLDMEGFVAIASRVTETKPNEEQTASQWLATMTSAQVSNVIAALSSAPVDEGVDGVDESAPEEADVDENGRSETVSIV